MKNIFSTRPDTRRSLLLAVLTGVLLGVAYPPFPLGVFAYVGFVPLFFLLERLDGIGRSVRYLYLTFFIMCAISLYWVGGFTHLKDQYLMMAGGLLLVWQPVYFTFAMLVFVFVKKQFGAKAGVLSFPFIWVTFEWLYALSQASFPWLTLGNTQTYYLQLIQFIEITGVYGLSFWILVLNVIAYFIVAGIMAKGMSKTAAWQAALFAIVFVMPLGYTLVRPDVTAPEKDAKPVTIGIIQPNIDPWDKWEGSSTFAGRWKQTLHYLDLIGRQKKDSVDISILPETAILIDLPSNSALADDARKILDSLNIGVVSGYIGMHIYTPGTEPRASSVFRGTNVHYDAYNSVLYLQPHWSIIQTYNKMRLVPFAERIPFADEVPSLIDPLRWGVGISNWGIGKDSTVFRDVRSNVKFLAMVCYESIYPEYVSSYVKKGAEFLIFITNDSWWGNTSGARQHNRYAVLRAVENRRWVARCANGGISSFIDPDGVMYDQTPMYTEASIHHRIETRTDLTFYAQHGDWLGRLCAVVSALWFLAALMQFILRLRSRGQRQSF
jgi:apolipoprotein N-acyltransferase